MLDDAEKCGIRPPLQSNTVFYDPMPRKYRSALVAGFKAMLSACSQSKSGVESCNCSSSRDWTIKNPRKSITDTFFCLPEACVCRDGSVEEFDLWVRSVGVELSTFLYLLERGGGLGYGL